MVATTPASSTANVFAHLDARLDLCEEEAMIVDGVKALAQERFAARAEHYDATGEFPWANVHELNELGLNAMYIPEEYGGSPCSYIAYLECVRQISRACASTGVIWATTFHAMKPLIDFGSHEQKSRLLPIILAGGLGALAITEPSAGSDAGAMQTRFTADGDDIIVNGTKAFITNGDVADLLLLFGKWSTLGSGRDAISALIVEKGAPGLSVMRKEDKMGHRASSTVCLSFDDVRVPRANLLGAPGDGRTILLASLNKSRPSVAAQALGIARTAFEDAVAYINDRVQSGRRIIEFQGIQFLLADLATDLALCEAWLWHVGRLVESGARDFNIEASMLKLRASDIAMRIAEEAVQLHGGYGYCKEYRVERLMRDAKLTQIWEGTNQIHRGLIGRSFMTR